MGSVSLRNEAAPGAPYFTPYQNPPAGTAVSENHDTIPNLFKPLTIRGTTFPNRAWVAPMCMYSAQDGHLTDFHVMHVGGLAFRGAGLTIIEATAVQANGRISPEDSGLWKDSQIAPLKRVADFVHSQGQKVGIQLAHAGRKASTLAPWLVKRGEKAIARKDAGGWEDDIVGPSAIRWSEEEGMPREMTEQEIRDYVNDFRASAKRAVAAGIDAIEIHGAHGYLLCSFLSPLSNRRTDKYGGSFENRTRLLVEVIEAVRGVIPSDMPLLLRVSATEWMEEQAEESWDVEQTIRLAKMLPALGVDLLDLSSGGNNKKQKIDPFNEFQIGIAGKVRAELHKAGVKNLLIGAVGTITEAEQAKKILDEAPGTIEIRDEQGTLAKADVVLVGRQFLREPEWVLKTAARLGVDVKLPNQYTWAPYPKTLSKM
ncbi:NADPH dehydrogenase [Coleophoma crateriformis]|uniref:NADPH dehydrogenase n=1 Tax=Coleophoma crateriformis TaxID=565419 RepID=A0A3D8Q681_9HELO|nr:NADPH dehydrogenase [Coleophoma crateriformis]